MHQNPIGGGQRAAQYRLRKQTVAVKSAKKDQKIIIENFYLLKTAQSLIDHAVEEMYRKFYSEFFELKE